MASVRVLQREEEIDAHPDIVADHISDKSDGNAGDN